MSGGQQALAAARNHIAVGEHAQALRLLATAVMALPGDPAHASQTQAELAVLYAGVLLATGQPTAARGWAGYGYQACSVRYGPQNRRTLHALGLECAALARSGEYEQATGGYTQLVEAYILIEGAHGQRTLAARADMAVVEHAQGRCSGARLRLAGVIDEYQRCWGVHGVGLRMQVRLAQMWRDCGGYAAAQELLAETREAIIGCDPDGTLLEMVDSATVAVADPYHRCGGSGSGGVPSTQDPHTPPARAQEQWANGALTQQTPMWDYLTPPDWQPPPPLSTAQSATRRRSLVALIRSRLPRWVDVLQPAGRLRQDFPERPGQSLILLAGCTGIAALALLFAIVVRAG